MHPTAALISDSTAPEKVTQCLLKFRALTLLQPWVQEALLFPLCVVRGSDPVFLLTEWGDADFAGSLGAGGSSNSHVKCSLTHGPLFCGHSDAVGHFSSRCTRKGSTSVCCCFIFMLYLGFALYLLYFKWSQTGKIEGALKFLHWKFLLTWIFQRVLVPFFPKAMDNISYCGTADVSRGAVIAHPLGG